MNSNGGTVSVVDLTDEKYMQMFYLGYVPKEISYSLALLLDSKHVFKVESVTYTLVGK